MKPKKLQVKLLPFRHHLKCPKCLGSSEFNSSYHACRFGNAACSDLEVDKEHLHRTCSGCGYHWIEECN